MKRENKSGSITKIKGLRKPFKATVTTGYNYDKGTQLRKCLGYFKTRLEAEVALRDFSQNPEVFDLKNLTFLDVHNLFLKAKETKGVSETTLKSYGYNLKHCESIKNIKINEIKLLHLQTIFTNENQKATDEKLAVGSMKVLKSYIKQIIDYAKSMQLISDNPAEFIVLPKFEKKYKKEPFTDEELEILWNNLHVEYVDTILILIYTGLRIEEFLELEIEKHINVEKMLITHGKKTNSGKNRVIPIHPKIQQFILNRIQGNNKFLVQGRKGPESKMLYKYYLDTIFKPLMISFGMKHTPHDCRHTFASLLDNANVNENVITSVLGHSSFLTTKKHYIHKDVNELKKGIEQIN